MYIAIGKKALQQPKPTKLHPPVEERRTHKPQLDPVCFPVMTAHTIHPKYHCELMQRTFQWLQQFSEGEPRLVTWYQLAALFEEQTGTKGFQYDTYLKHWHTAPLDTRDDMARRTGLFSSYVQGLPSCHGITKVTRHARSASCILSFWTRCIPVQMTQELWQHAEQVLLQKATHLASVRDVRDRL